LPRIPRSNLKQQHDNNSIQQHGKTRTQILIFVLQNIKKRTAPPESIFQQVSFKNPSSSMLDPSSEIVTKLIERALIMSLNRLIQTLSE